MTRTEQQEIHKRTFIKEKKRVGGECKKQPRSVLEGAAAAGFVDELLQHGAVHLPESGRLRHLRQVVDAEAEAKLFQVLRTGTSRGSRSSGEG